MGLSGRIVAWCRQASSHYRVKGRLLTMEVKWIEYEGKKILYSNFQGAKNEDELLKTLNTQIEILRKEAQKTLLLVNIGDVHATDKFNSELRRLSKEVVQPKTSKSAMVGITGVKKIIFSAIIRFSGENAKLFDTEEDAKKWLAG
jgi:hypothetical protein